MAKFLFWANVVCALLNFCIFLSAILFDNHFQLVSLLCMAANGVVAEMLYEYAYPEKQ